MQSRVVRTAQEWTTRQGEDTPPRFHGEVDLIAFVVYSAWVEHWTVDVESVSGIYFVLLR
jgi:hypothetical protein